ncbi:tRNA (adenine(22)-N(1))-methyltransferase [Paenibacillus endoradicis]|uniref:tRNA (adenine(22)-N(1))-methyltransferase n=1 Tax=Paenibacillus endoradicis TaxID=2972487 RepID=UPI002158CC34|nr:class I SAM-dependent methyltransferase [Paenibacillus endoradicis]MCR8659238.1 class I SAM-dependent methyltransferase [Paenibacillus endoradicis]
MIQLSKRLQTVADYITAGNKVADIGSDHALLPVYLIQSTKCPSAIAGELNEGPWQAARKQIANAGLSVKIDARRGNGLAVITPNEVDTITICGMGGVLMSDILEEGLQTGKLEGVKELVLQPNVGEDTVRRWLVQNHWALIDEIIIEEDGKIYEVLHAIRSDEADQHNKQLFSGKHISFPFSESQNETIMFRMGPHLLPKRNNVLLKKWQSEIQKLEYIMTSLQQSTLDSAKAKLEATEQEKNQISEVLKWLFTDKQ